MKFYYQYPERLKNIPKPDINSANGNIVIYGTEIIGGLMAAALENLGVTFKAYTDTDERKQGQLYHGHRIISPQELASNHPDAMVLVASSAYRQISSILLELGFKQDMFYPCSHILEGIELADNKVRLPENVLIRSINRYNGNIFTVLDNLKHRVLQELNVYPTTKCTLKCDNCIYETARWLIKTCYDEQMQIDAVMKLIDLDYEIDNIQIIGGEPLLYERLPSLLDAFCNIERIKSVVIVTNGTLPIKLELLAALIKNRSKVSFRISDYGELSPEVDGIRKLLADNNIVYGAANPGKWFKQARFQDFGLEDDEVKEKYTNCNSNHRSIGKLWLFGDRYYPCSRSGPVVNTGHELPESNYVRFDDPHFEERVEELFHCDTFYEACRYCDRSPTDMRIEVPVAEQLP